MVAIEDEQDYGWWLLLNMIGMQYLTEDLQMISTLSMIDEQ